MIVLIYLKSLLTMPICNRSSDRHFMLNSCFIALQEEEDLIKKRKIREMIEMGMNYSESFVKEHIGKWVNAWNNHDLKAVLSMYSDDIEFSSPKVKESLTSQSKYTLLRYNKQILLLNFFNYCLVESGPSD
jgi:hypothetical protein